MKRLKAFDGTKIRDVHNVIWKEDGSWRASLVESKSECEESGFIDSDTLNTMLLRPVCLQDKNGVEIYEDDIVRCREDGLDDWEYYRVVYCSNFDYPAFDLKGHDLDCNLLSNFKAFGEIEVAGNFNVNPEFLEDKSD